MTEKVLKVLKNHFEVNDFLLLEVRVDEGLGYTILDIEIDGKIKYSQIIDGGKFSQKEDEDTEAFEKRICEMSILTVDRQFEVFQRLNRIEVIKRRKEIMYMDSAEPTSFHGLKEDEFEKYCKFYEIRETELEKAKKDEEKEAAKNKTLTK